MFSIVVKSRRHMLYCRKCCWCALWRWKICKDCSLFQKFTNHACFCYL